MALYSRHKILSSRLGVLSSTRGHLMPTDELLVKQGDLSERLITLSDRE